MISVYETGTGRIKRRVVCSNGRYNEQVNAGESYVEGDYDDSLYYINNGVATLMPIMTPTVTGTTITGLPIPCSLTTYGNTYEITDGEVTLNYDLAGEYLVKVQAFPYLDWEVTVHAN